MQIKAWLSGALLVLSSASQAADDWWFDVEVIAFKRNVDINALQEQFPLSQDFSDVQYTWDVISQSLYPDIAWVKQNLGQCDTPISPIWYDTPSLEDIGAMYESWRQSLTPEALAAHDETQALLEGNEQAQMIAEDLLQQTEALNETIPAPSEAVFDPVDDTGDLLWSGDLIAEQWLYFHGPKAYDSAVFAATLKDCNPATDWLQFDGSQWVRHITNNRLPDLARTPIVVMGKDWDRSVQPHALSEEQFELADLSKQIRWRKGLERILHVAWRQEVKFGQDEADTVRLFAGTNFAEQYDADGKARVIDVAIDSAQAFTPIEENTVSEPVIVPAEQDIFSTIDDIALEHPTVPFARFTQLEQDLGTEEANDAARSPIWELDGGVKIFLKYINRVPYLHIDSQLAFRQATLIESDAQNNATSEQQYQLVSVPFNQLRRVISKQVHYFDHPMFGFVIELRRYQRPAAEQEPEGTVIQ